jgi:putative tryptophan/tyrosine transport system substrate-binding protein
VRAQQGERVRRVGVLTYGSDTPDSRWLLSILRDDLEHLGWSEKRNLRLDFRFGDGDERKTSAFASDLVQLSPDVIVTLYAVALRAVQQETKTIPVVFIGGGDPVELGNVINSARPEGNATGFTNAFGSLGGKWLELLKEVAPNITLVGYLYGGSPRSAYLRSIETAARSLGVEVIAIVINDGASVKAAIEAFATEPHGGLIPNPAVNAIVPPDELNRVVLQYRLPAVSAAPVGPISYSADGNELIRGSASYVDRLLRGAKVSDLPVQYPTKFRLVLNLKAAKALGLEVPPSLLVRADEVIERRPEFIAGLGAAAWPLTARAQQSKIAVIGVLSANSVDLNHSQIIPEFVAACRRPAISKAGIWLLSSGRRTVIMSACPPSLTI